MVKSILAYCVVKMRGNNCVACSSSVLLTAGHIEWQDKLRKQCLVMWRTPEEWGKLIYSWVRQFHTLHLHFDVLFYVTDEGVYRVGI